jgi:hypothetical protein
MESIATLWVLCSIYFVATRCCAYRKAVLRLGPSTSHMPWYPPFPWQRPRPRHRPLGISDRLCSSPCSMQNSSQRRNGGRRPHFPRNRVRISGRIPGCSRGIVVGVTSHHARIGTVPIRQHSASWCLMSQLWFVTRSG